MLRLFALYAHRLFLGVAVLCAAVVFWASVSYFFRGWFLWASVPVSLLVGYGTFVLLARMFEFVPRPTVTLERRALCSGLARLGRAAAWMVTYPEGSERLARYVEAQLSPEELEVFLVLADESDLSVDELIAHVRLLGVPSSDG